VIAVATATAPRFTRAAADEPEPQRETSPARIHAITATRVLLSVQSSPNGQPVQYAPNAYFWTIGPRISPPGTIKSSVHGTNRSGAGSPSSTPNPVRRTTASARNISRMWGIKT
jgi:hypothetical protein